MSAENELDIIVFGNQAVGKTSLLSSMYMQMEAQGVTSCNGMTFAPIDSDLFNTLRNKWIELRKKIRENEFTSTLVVPYQGTATFDEHKFAFTTRGKCQIVNFVDTKGANTGESDPTLIKRINESFFTICVVDAAVLMECDDIDNEELNSPMAIKRILMEVLDDGDHRQPISCFFTLTKCEKYMQTEAERNRMAKRFEEIFRSVLDYAAEKRFPLFYLPVQTMGCVEFSRIDPITREMRFKTVNKEFQPVDVIFPLAHLLKVFLYILHRRQQNRSWYEALMDWWYDLQEDYNLYYNSMISKVGDPIDFRGNNYGHANNLEPMDFWE